MPVLEKIIVKDFRNIPFAEIAFSPRINCICGDNGQGKTNLLDAVHYLSLIRSAFNVSDSFCYRHGTDSFTLSGLYRMQDGTSSRFVVTSSKEGGRAVKRDDKVYSRLSAHMGVLPAVIVSPQDSSLVSESGEERRRFVNTVLSQLDATYLASLQRYNKALAERNAVLKVPEPDQTMLDVLEGTLASSAAPIVQSRLEFASRLSEAVRGYYSILSGGRESVEVVYRSVTAVSADVEEALRRALREGRKRDLILKYTTTGVQRDDFDFLMDGHPIRRCGSQGQQKSFLVALKLAQYDIMRGVYGFPPILLLDDVFDKLDSERMANMLKLVGSNDFGQIFVTDTNRIRLEAIVEGIGAEARFFNASNGEF